MPPEDHPRYLWWPPKVAQAIREQLNAAPDGVILKVHAPFNEHARIEVADPTAPEVQALDGSGGGFNEAHICPPVCP